MARPKRCLIVVELHIPDWLPRPMLRMIIPYNDEDSVVVSLIQAPPTAWSRSTGRESRYAARAGAYPCVTSSDKKIDVDGTNIIHRGVGGVAYAEQGGHRYAHAQAPNGLPLNLATYITIASVTARRSAPPRHGVSRRGGSSRCVRRRPSPSDRRRGRRHAADPAGRTAAASACPCL